MYILTYIVGLALFFAVLQCWPGRFTKVLKFSLYISFYFSAFADLICKDITGEGLSPAITQLLFETDKREIKEFLSGYSCPTINLHIFILFSLLLVNIILEKKVRLQKFSVFKKKSIKLVVLSSLFCSVIWLGYSVVKYTDNRYLDELEFTWNGEDIPQTCIGRLIVSLWINGQNAYHVLQLEKQNNSADIIACRMPLCDVVLIIGESYNKYHSQLYGYDKATTPNQLHRAKTGDLLVFYHATTPYNLTSPAIKTMMSCHSDKDNMQWWQSPWFPVLFRKAGYESYLISNQSSEQSVSLLAKYNLGVVWDNTTISHQLFDKRNNQTHSYDEGLLSNFDTLNTNNSNKRLFIFHLMGQHFNYKNRYPNERHKFHIDDYQRDDLSDMDISIIAHYDNATAYNDSVVNALLKRFENRNAVVVYLSDHGEQVFDELPVSGRTFDRTVNLKAYRYEYEIPMWIWFSEAYKQASPNIVKKVSFLSSNPFHTTQLSKLMFFLGGIITE